MDLPKGSALTAIFDSCTSATLLGKIPVHSHRPQPLMLRKTSDIISATACIDPGSIEEVGEATPVKTVLVRQHCMPLVRYFPSPHPPAQSGGAGGVGWSQSHRRRHQPTRVGVQMGNEANPQSDAMDGAARGQRFRPFSMLMWCVGL